MSLPLGLLFPLTPTMGPYSSHWPKQWDTIPPPDTIEAAQFLPLIPKMGLYCCSHWPHTLGFFLLPLTTNLLAFFAYTLNWIRGIVAQIGAREIFWILNSHLVLLLRKFKGPWSKIWTCQWYSEATASCRKYTYCANHNCVANTDSRVGNVRDFCHSQSLKLF